MLRYLRTLTAWVPAMRAVVRFCHATTHSPQVSLVQLADHSGAARSDIEKNSQGIIKYLLDQISVKCKDNPDMMERAAGWINGRFQDKDRKSRLPFRVHAEAGLMALLREAGTGSQDIPSWVHDLCAVCGAPLNPGLASD